MIWGLKPKTDTHQKNAQSNSAKAENKTADSGKLIECVPNFSLGHDRTVMHKIVDSIKASHVDVINDSYDEDHNRLVVTFIGNPDNVLKAAFNSIKTASEMIDINKQEGVHPFIGSTDVVPFIPLKNSNANDCKDIAKKLGAMVGQDLSIPVYLYGDAARNDFLKHLHNIRYGGLALIKNMINTKEYKPDFGPLQVHPLAGAVAIGVRDFLIAFNFNLESDDLKVAKDIAKKIREKDGGLKGIRALGVPLNSKGIVQITVNVTNFKQTGLKVLFDTVKKEAASRGIEIKNTELIGLIPQAATFPNMKEYLRLDDFDEGMVLETYL